MNIDVMNEIPKEEIEHYRKYISDKYDGAELTAVELDGECVVLRYEKKPAPFDRIRRITGYLARTTNFNIAKQNEEVDRLKHDTAGGYYK